MNRKQLIVLPVLLGSLAGGCGGGGGGSGGDTGGGPGQPDSPSISAVNSTDANFSASATPRMNERAYYQVTGSHLPATLALAVADCAGMKAISTSSTEARFQCMPSNTEGTKSITVQDSAGGTTLYSASIPVLASL